MKEALAHILWKIQHVPNHQPSYSNWAVKEASSNRKSEQQPVPILSMYDHVGIFTDVYSQTNPNVCKCSYMIHESSAPCSWSGWPWSCARPTSRFFLPNPTADFTTPRFFVELKQMSENRCQKQKTQIYLWISHLSAPQGGETPWCAQKTRIPLAAHIRTPKIKIMKMRSQILAESPDSSDQNWISSGHMWL